MVSESTMYRLIDYGLFDAKNIDLPRKVRYARRKKKKVYKVDKSCRLGRTYADYQLYIREHPDLPVTQIDSVEGRKGGKVLLTIHFVKAEFMLISETTMIPNLSLMCLNSFTLNCVRTDLCH